MRILYLGDVMGEVGMKVVERSLPSIRSEYSIDVVVAQSENVTSGKGLSVDDCRRLRKAGIDGFTGGNWSTKLTETLELLANPEVPVTAPANMHDTPGPGYKYVNAGNSKVLIVSLLGQIVGRDAEKPKNNPLLTIDKILESQHEVDRAATIVNFHGDFSSEKVVFGHYLDGRVSLVVGDHWHVPTADARVLPGGTAHMTDVGMCGTLNSSLGVTYESVIPRWREGHPTKNELALEPPFQLNAVLVEVGEDGLAKSARHIQKIFED
jgi:metallophosphoesterase (TIGR00282 family)